MEETLKKIRPLLEEITPTSVKTICYAGLILNVLSAIVLSRPQMRNTHINLLLLGLTFADALLLGCSIGRWSGFVRELDPYYIIRKFFYYSAKSSSIFLTLTISIERLVVIYWPFRGRALFTLSRAKWVLLFVFSFGVCMGGTEQVFWTYYYNFYKNCWVLISSSIRIAIPFVSLLILNILIYSKLRKSAKDRATMRNESTAEENSITKMLLCVVVVFGICYSFGFLNKLFRYLWLSSPDDSEFRNSYFLIYSISFYLNPITTCINSSANFIIYIAMGKKFRDEFNKIVSRVFRFTKRNRQSEVIELDEGRNT